MTDKYRNFLQLAESERPGRDFRVRYRHMAGTTLIMAPHGGRIEPGTSDIAEAIAADDLSFYAFEGIKLRGNRDLHITSTRFDEPDCVALVQASLRAISVHGENSPQEVVFVGGRDGETLKRVRTSLARRGFCVKRHVSRGLQAGLKRTSAIAPEAESVFNSN